jgi:hypothetical protein
LLLRGESKEPGREREEWGIKWFFHFSSPFLENYKNTSIDWK